MGYLNVLLSATSFNDFVERWDDIRYLIAANERTVRERRDAERAVAFVQRELERQRLELSYSAKREQQDKYPTRGARRPEVATRRGRRSKTDAAWRARSPSSKS